MRYASRVPTPETEQRLTELRRKRAASMHLGQPAPSYKERVAAIDKEIARLEALGD